MGMVRLPLLRIIVDPHANSGAWNMAVDEALLQSAIEGDVATLRWYAWCEPTVSLGYFQREAELAGDPRLASLPRVRRLSGGGALVHDRELTYSLTIPSNQRLVSSPLELYGLVHDSFIEAFRQRGIVLKMRGTTSRQQDEPILCFQRQDEHDLVLDGHKVLGSAQRRRRGAILQHGGLLLGSSDVTPTLPGIGDLATNADLTELEQSVTDVLSARISESALTGTLSEVERRFARREPEQPDSKTC